MTFLFVLTSSPILIIKFSDLLSEISYVAYQSITLKK